MAAMRGDELRRHILYAAKAVFMEMGFERASMDEIAERAKTSKRTLYAYFENKDKLFLAIIDLGRSMFLSRMKRPEDYSADTTEAIVQFCGRFLEGLLFGWTIRMCRLGISEAAQFPSGSADYFAVIFSETQERLSAYIGERLDLSPEASAEAAQALIGRVIYPRFPRALFGIDELSYELNDEAISPDFDLAPIRKAVAELVESHIAITK